ncbi:hypothetical protein ACFLV5_01030 [Chloroflexota bacterium]
MPDKPRHDRRKHHPQSRKSKAKQRSAEAIAHPPVAAQPHKPAVHTGMPAPSAGVPTTPTASPVARYPYITTELRRIGILAGIMLGILIVLALLLS